MMMTPRFGALVLPNQEMSAILQQAKHLENIGFDFLQAPIISATGRTRHARGSRAGPC
jgi:hypothetical protein